MRPAAIVPIRSFDGLTRLAAALDARERNALMRRLAERTTTAAGDAGAAVTVVTGDGAVRIWAEGRGFAVIDEPEPPGLDAAASAGIDGVHGAWMIIHADLPAITAVDLGRVMRVLDDGRRVLAPSHDGGTSLIGGSGITFAFSYGVGSFRRHLAAVPDAVVLARPGLALDLDRPQDIATLQALAAI
jgi:2-phospho-L-lactate guanylyltransferase